MGESGCDVYDRTAQWWHSTVICNLTGRLRPPDTIVVFTHGLTMRVLLMMVLGWSVDTFHTVWNAENCHIYVLKKDLEQKSQFPYALDPVGDMPQSSAMIIAKVAGKETQLKLNDYLSLPRPDNMCGRSSQTVAAARMLEEQHNLPHGSVEVVDMFDG